MTVAIIGAGVMGETLLSGLLRAGTPTGELLVCEKRAERAAELTERYAVSVVDSTAKVAGAEIKLAKFVRFQLGEGIEKKVDDFAAEVAAAAGTNKAEPVA